MNKSGFVFIYKNKEISAALHTPELQTLSRKEWKYWLLLTLNPKFLFVAPCSLARRDVFTSILILACEDGAWRQNTMHPAVHPKRLIKRSGIPGPGRSDPIYLGPGESWGPAQARTLGVCVCVCDDLTNGPACRSEFVRRRRLFSRCASNPDSQLTT